MALCVNWSESEQLRHAAQFSRLRSLRGGQRASILDLERELRNLGYDGIVAGLSAESIVQSWTEKGWVKISPNGSELRLTEAGIEQFAQWEEEDALWERGTTEEIQCGKRLKAGEPATNLRKLAQVIRSGTLIRVHDPYIDEKTLETLQKLKGLGVDISKTLLLLTAPKIAKAAASVNSFLRDLNAEMGTKLELRAYSGTTKPHRRFLILQDKSVITCGLSLNNMNKDEALDHLPMGVALADYDRRFFDNCWASATSLVTERSL
jgi:hypothetical protein